MRIRSGLTATTRSIGRPGGPATPRRSDGRGWDGRTVILQEGLDGNLSAGRRAVGGQSGVPLQSPDFNGSKGCGWFVETIATMKVLVTGAAGCLGRAVLWRLALGGHQVRAVDLTSRDGASASVEWVTADLTTEDLDTLVVDCDAVIHLAALVHRPDVTDPTMYRRINVEITEALADAASAAAVVPTRFIFSSTVGVYGRDHDLHADESSIVAPATPYAASKLDAERAVLKRGGVVLRFPVVYGAGDRGNVAQLIRAVAAGRFVLPGRCTAPRSLVASANAAEACVRALEGVAPTGVYLVTDNDDRSVRVLVETMASSLIPPVRVRTAPYAPIWCAAAAGSMLGGVGVRSPITLDALRKLTTPLTFSCELARQTFGYQPVLRFDEAVAAAVADLVPAKGV